MPCACLDNPSTVAHVAHLLDTVKRIGIDDLERIVQQAHECDIHQIAEPVEPFPVTRRALRMFWHFRCNLESVEVMSAHG
ncbi:MAG: hypothetical protein JJU36_05810 [Phycisphaeraceae bacterium]|nr:hypothetical protein [Phycisphaeraceae bacterium]